MDAVLWNFVFGILIRLLPLLMIFMFFSFYFIAWIFKKFYVLREGMGYFGVFSTYSIKAVNSRFLGRFRVFFLFWPFIWGSCVFYIATKCGIICFLWYFFVGQNMTLVMKISYFWDINSGHLWARNWPSILFLNMFWFLDKFNSNERIVTLL